MKKSLVTWLFIGYINIFLEKCIFSKRLFSRLWVGDLTFSKIRSRQNRKEKRIKIFDTKKELREVYDAAVHSTYMRICVVTQSAACLPNRWTGTGWPAGCCCWPRGTTSAASACCWAAGVWRSVTSTWTRSCRSWCRPARRWASGRPLRRTRRRGPSATSPRTNRAATTTSAGVSLSEKRETKKHVRPSRSLRIQYIWGGGEGGRCLWWDGLWRFVKIILFGGFDTISKKKIKTLSRTVVQYHSRDVKIFPTTPTYTSFLTTLYSVREPIFGKNINTINTISFLNKEESYQIFKMKNFLKIKMLKERLCYFTNKVVIYLAWKFGILLDMTVSHLGFFSHAQRFFRLKKKRVRDILLRRRQTNDFYSVLYFKFAENIS